MAAPPEPAPEATEVVPAPPTEEGPPILSARFKRAFWPRFFAFTLLLATVVMAIVCLVVAGGDDAHRQVPALWGVLFLQLSTSLLVLAKAWRGKAMHMRVGGVLLILEALCLAWAGVAACSGNPIDPGRFRTGWGAAEARFERSCGPKQPYFLIDSALCIIVGLVVLRLEQRLRATPPKSVLDRKAYARLLAGVTMGLCCAAALLAGYTLHAYFDLRYEPHEAQATPTLNQPLHPPPPPPMGPSPSPPGRPMAEVADFCDGVLLDGSPRYPASIFELDYPLAEDVLAARLDTYTAPLCAPPLCLPVTCTSSPAYL